MPRPRAWADRIFNVTLLNNGQNKENLLTIPTPADTLTAVRIIGHIMVVSGASNEGEYTQAIDLGIGVASGEAFNIGVTALPSPAVEDEYPARGWLYRQRDVTQQAIPTGATPVAMYKRPALFDFDLRAMRRIDKGVLYMMITCSEINGSGPANTVLGTVRVLCLT